MSRSLATRREFLKLGLGTSALLSLGATVPGFLAKTALASMQGDDRILVVVELTGGNDGLNTVVPFRQDAYKKARPTLALSADDVHKLNDDLGLHPAMSAAAELYKAGRMAVIQGVGYPNPDRSHFRSMDIWHSAQPENPKPEDGWLGRSLTRLASQNPGDVPAMHLGQNELPLALANMDLAVPSFASLDNFRLKTQNGSLPIATLRTLASSGQAAGGSLLDFVQRASLNAYASSERVQEALAGEKDDSGYPELGLAQKLKTVGQLIGAGLTTRIYYVSLENFDTHATQAQGHAALLRELSESVSAFMQDLEKRGQLERVLVLSYSEFGRRVEENASGGTDHGTAAPVYAWGSKLVSGIHGEHPSFGDLDQGDLKFHTDFRGVYAPLLDQWLGCSSQEILGRTFEPVRFVA